MKVYINKETGITIETESELNGDWELVETTEKPKVSRKRKVDKDEIVEE